MAGRVTLAPLDLTTLDGLSADALALFVGEDERPLQGLAGLVDWRCVGALSRLLQQGSLTGAASERFLTLTNAALPIARVFVFGLGPLARVTPESFATVAAAAGEALQRAGIRHVVTGLPDAPAPSSSAGALAEAFTKCGLQTTLVGAAGSMPPGR